MTTQAERLQFAPPPTPGMVRALGLAIVAHLVLVVFLTMGVQWKHDTVSATVEAELWAAIPVEAAPPAPPPEPPAPEPEPLKPAPREVAPPPPAPTPPDPSIALAREKARKLEEKKLQQQLLEQEKRLNEKLKAEKLQKETREKLEKEKLAKEKAAKEKKNQPDPKQAAAEAKRLELERQKNIQRMTAMAAGSGDASSAGSAARSAGPSATYAGRIVARIRPNIVYTESTAGNIRAEVEVRTAPDGTILSRKIVKSSGVKAWDDAVVAAIDKTEVLPRDTDGRVPSAMTIGFSPKDQLSPIP